MALLFRFEVPERSDCCKKYIQVRNQYAPCALPVPMITGGYDHVGCEVIVLARVEGMGESCGREGCCWQMRGPSPRLWMPLIKTLRGGTISVAWR